MPKPLKLYAYLLVALAIPPEVAAQKLVLKAQPPTSRFREINDTVIAKFNRGDYKGIYEAAGDHYKSLNNEGGLVYDLESKKKDVAKIISSELVEDLGKVEHLGTAKPSDVPSSLELRRHD